MPHSVFTIVCTVERTQLAQLRAALAMVDADPGANAILPFARLAAVHFASITIFDADPSAEPFMVFENNIDGAIGPYLTQLSALSGLWQIVSCARDAPGARTDEAMRAYLASHLHKPNLFHVGTPYRTACNIVRDRVLRRLLEWHADRLAARPGPKSPAWVWEELRSAVNAPPSRSAALVPTVGKAGTCTWLPEPEPRLWSRVLHWSLFAGLALITVAVTTYVNARLWRSPLRLAATTAAVASAIGVWNAILVGWPSQGRWRNPANITVWYAAAGAALGLLPSAVRLLNVAWPHAIVWVAPFLLASVSAAALFMMGGYWDVPSADEGGFTVDPAQMAAAIAQEDRGVQNHMSALVMLRGGWIRLWSLRILLWILNHTWFPTVLRDLEGGHLFDLPTVHFAQWVTLGNGRYVFLSNYDHSWSRYLDDFGVISVGLARLWGQGTGSPGLASLTRFKAFARSWSTPYSVWYRAYPGLSVTQIWDNETIRLGLLRPADDDESLRLLRRLTAAVDR